MKKTISIIGGGSAALFIASFLDTKKFDVTIYEKNKSLGRKFLVAGDGGFNLTHSEPIKQIAKRYTPTKFLKKALNKFDNEYLQEWFEEIGISTFIGSSKRVYPEKGIKPIEVLNAILEVLNNNKVKINYNQNWTGWDNNNSLTFESGDLIKSDITIFALGGASWSVTGSDGTWIDKFDKKGIATTPFKPSNCAYKIDWDEKFIKKNEGDPLKNISISCDKKTQKGEVVITKFGLEGNAIYALSPQIRKQLDKKKKALIHIDLKPALEIDDIINKIESSNLKNTTDTLKVKLKLNPAQIGLLKTYVSKDNFIDPKSLAEKIKKLPLHISGTAPIEEAISTIGGISLSAIDDYYQLSELENQFCIGEMIDYDAPTGGYLLQSCFSMATYLASHLNKNTSTNKK